MVEGCQGPTWSQTQGHLMGWAQVRAGPVMSLPSVPSVGHSSDAGAGGFVHAALSMDGLLSSRTSRGLSRAAGQTAF